MNAKDRDRVKRLFDALAERRFEIEQAFGGPLAWERLDAKTPSRIATYREGRVTAPPHELESISEWVAATLVRLYRALSGPLEQAVAERDRHAEAS